MRFTGAVSRRPVPVAPVGYRAGPLGRVKGSLALLAAPVSARTSSHQGRRALDSPGALPHSAVTGATGGLSGTKPAHRLQRNLFSL